MLHPTDEGLQNAFALAMWSEVETYHIRPPIDAHVIAEMKRTGVVREEDVRSVLDALPACSTEAEALLSESRKHAVPVVLFAAELLEHFNRA